MNDKGTGQAGEPTDSQTHNANNPPHRILVADDDRDLREFSVEVLIRSGYQVDAAEDGAVAWEALQNEAFSLLITDHNMPKLTGVELVKKLRSARLAVPVILATGTLPTIELDRNPNLQLAAMLLKPFTPDELLGTVREVLRATNGACEQRAPSANSQSQPSADGWRL